MNRPVVSRRKAEILGADDLEALLTARGWKASLAHAGDPEVSFGRWTLPVIPHSVPGVPRKWLVTAVR